MPLLEPAHVLGCLCASNHSTVMGVGKLFYKASLNLVSISAIVSILAVTEPPWIWGTHLYIVSSIAPYRDVICRKEHFVASFFLEESWNSDQLPPKMLLCFSVLKFVLSLVKEMQKKGMQL